MDKITFEDLYQLDNSLPEPDEDETNITGPESSFIFLMSEMGHYGKTESVENDDGTYYTIDYEKMCKHAYIDIMKERGSFIKDEKLNQFINEIAESKGLSYGKVIEILKTKTSPEIIPDRNDDNRSSKQAKNNDDYDR